MFSNSPQEVQGAEDVDAVERLLIDPGSLG
jgi:hypothetical protein